ncbi:hypothetical protein ABEF93_006561 [Exophiala dermatitidis]
MAPRKHSHTSRHRGVAALSSPIIPTEQIALNPSRPSAAVNHNLQSIEYTPGTPPFPTQFLAENTATLTRPPIAGDSPLSPTEGQTLDSTSRRESTSTMRTSSIPLEGTPTCTPTGRISKAKKGKRVHACEFPGCGKVFTRAEHRRRHQLNHNPEALFPCTRPRCRKAFHRIDLLQRHLERHDLDSMAEASSTHMGHMSHISAASESPSSVIPTPIMSSPHASQSTRRSNSGALSIGSLVNPQGDYRYNVGTPAFNSYGRQSMHYIPPGFTSSEDSIFYTPESSQSPVSDYYSRYHPNRQSISSSSSVAAFELNGASPLTSGNIPGQWAPSSAPPASMPAATGSILDEGAYVPTLPYQFHSPSWMETNGTSFDENYQLHLGFFPEIPQPLYQQL